MKVGELIADRYELEELVGEGGMSSVYRARDSVLEREVAIKALHEHFSSDPEYVERFRREARAIARLAHPNIVTVIDRGEWEGRQFIVFEHVAGETLKEVVDREGPLPLERALELACQIARALAFAHDVGIVHRDVKPHNVLVDAGGTAKVTDFGIARTLDVDDGLTESGTVLGTGHYLSPEQAGGERADEASDQYSFGVVLYELLAGEVPYSGASVVAVAARHVNEPVPRVRAARPEVPEGVERVVARAMAKRPEDRYPSMHAVVSAIEACLAEVAEYEQPPPVDEDTSVLPAGGVAAPRPPRARRPPPRGRRSVVLLVAVLGAAALAAGLLAAQLLLDDGVPGLPAGGGEDGSGETRIRLRAVSDFDPSGDQTEHPESVPNATDGDAATYWTTETYSSFAKPGVGIVLDARRPVALSRLVVVSDEPGFTAVIMAADRADGPFDSVSEEQEVARRTEFELDVGDGRRYYLVWITAPNSRAHVNEVRAFAES